MTNLFTNLLNLSDSSRAHRVHTLALTVGSPSAHRRGTMLRLCSVVAILLTIGVGNVWGTETTVYTFATAKSTNNTAYASNYNVTISSKSWSVPGNQNFSGYVRIGGKNLSKVDRIIKSNDAISGPITKVTLNHGGKSNNSLTVHSITLTVASNSTFSSIISTETKTPEISLSTAGTVTFTPPSPLTSWPNNSYYKITINVSNSSSSNNYGLDVKSIAFIKETFTVSYNNNGGSGTMTDSNSPYLKGSTVTVKSNSFTAPDGKTFNNWNTASGGSGTSYAAGNTFNIVGNTTLYAQWETVASCSVNPTAGAASLNGSFNLTTVGVSCASSGAGTNCTITNYGWVWSDGATNTDPLNDGSGVTKHNTSGAPAGSGGSFTGTLSGSFTVGHTYYYKAYVINGKPATTYSTVQTFTPRSITFYKNDGGATTTTQYVPDGVSTNLTSNSFSRTGYTFNGWNTDADGTSGTGYTNGQSVSLSANLTLYAKWTAKTTTISFNQNSGSGGQTGTLTATYDAAMPSAPVTCPKRPGYDFGGYYDGSGGTGTQYYTSTGASARTWNKENATWTLYAKWTIKSYSVTWKVNNTDYTTGTPTSSVNHGSKVTKLPTAPDPASYCGSKFMGWTDATDGAYVHGTSNLYTAASQFPAAEGAQVFYAVFADYVAP